MQCGNHHTAIAVEGDRPGFDHWLGKRGDTVATADRRIQMKSILDPTFRYVPSASTDVRKTFARIRREMQKSGASTTRSSTDPSRVLMFSRAKESVSRG